MMADIITFPGKFTPVTVPDLANSPIPPRAELPPTNQEPEVTIGRGVVGDIFLMMGGALLFNLIHQIASIF